MNSNIKLYYRHICKNIKNRDLFRSFIVEEIKKPNSNNNYTKIIPTYLMMRQHIKNENDLLESYGVNIIRDHRKAVEMTARYVGLEIDPLF